MNNKLNKLFNDLEVENKSKQERASPEAREGPVKLKKDFSSQFSFLHSTDLDPNENHKLRGGSNDRTTREQGVF